MVRLDSVDKEKMEKVKQRWERIATETIKQSATDSPPTIASPISFKKFISSYFDNNSDHATGTTTTTTTTKRLGYMFHTTSSSAAIGALVPRFLEERKRIESSNTPLDIVLIVGPEGGFTPEEVELATKAGIECVGLGDTILKTDTAFVSVISFFRFLFDSSCNTTTTSTTTTASNNSSNDSNRSDSPSS